MSDTFGHDYADVYDRMYATKDYREETDVVEGIIPLVDPAPRLLDMGCGTGGHALTLARRGYRMSGVDLSAAMVDVARRKAQAEDLMVDWHVGDIVDVRVDGQFDGVIAMFAVLGYLTETDRLLAFLRNARAHLRPGGKLVFDVWYGAAVLSEGPAERAKVIEQDDGSVVRAVHPVLHADRNVVDVHTRLWRIVGDRVVFDATELHPVRYFFVPELEHLLDQASFRPTAFYRFPDVDAPPAIDGWSLGCVAEAVG